MNKMFKNKKDLFSLEIERVCLSVIINHSQECIDFLPLIGESHFIEPVHSCIFSIAKDIAISGKTVDVAILTERVASLGITQIEDVNIFDYLLSLRHFNAANKESIPEYFRSLNKYFNARELSQTGQKIISFINENIEKSSQDLISGTEKIFADKINHYQSENDPIDIFKDLEDEIELLGNDPKEDGIECPYVSLKRFYGNFLNGGLYVFAAPPKNGKSTLLIDILRKTCSPQKVRGLYLDTELTTHEQRLRLTSAFSNVNEYYIRTGKYRYDKKMLNSVRSIWPLVRSMEKSIDHLYVAGKPIDEIISIIRRWHYKNIHNGVKSIIVYDYIKLTGEKISDSWKEYQVIGQKTDKLKQIAQELKCPVVAAVQTNSENDVAMSKQIKWFVNTLAMFRKKTAEELEFCGNKFGSHILTVTESRNQGEEAFGFSDLVKLPDGEYKRFFINFDISNFNIEDKGSILDVIALKNSNFEIEKDSNTENNEIF
jgi:replicative DNA helicase